MRQRDVRLVRAPGGAHGLNCCCGQTADTVTAELMSCGHYRQEEMAGQICEHCMKFFK